MSIERKKVRKLNISPGRRARVFFQERGTAMSQNERSNRCIGCTVDNCAHHAKSENYCTLHQVSIGTHESDPTEPKCADCESFSLDR